MEKAWALEPEKTMFAVINAYTRGAQHPELNSEETKNPKEGEVVYIDDKEVLCRRWNWRECDKSKMTEETTNVALVVEGLPPTSKEEVEMNPRSRSSVLRIAEKL